MSKQSIALAELASYIEENSCYGESVPVFKLSDLAKLYRERLINLGTDVPNRINSTRLKERLLHLIPDLKAQTQGRDILLVFDDDIGEALKIECDNDEDSEANILAKAAQIVRKELYQIQQQFNGSFSADCQKDAVSDTLRTLVRMILDGASIEKQESVGRCAAVDSISQLMIYNSVKHAPTPNSNNIRHNKDKETPLPIYLGLMIHATTRSRTIIDKLHSLGLSISYNRTMQISTNLANSVCERYESEGLVCPPQLRKNVFTTAAMDNLDHNTSSTTAIDSFHGTAISLTNHVSHECRGESRVISGLMTLLNSWR